MKTITLNNGNTYTQQDNGYCFATIDGKKVRCSAASFKMAYDQFVLEENERQNAANEFTNIDPITAEDIERDARALEEYLQESDEDQTTEGVKRIRLDEAMKKLGYYPIESEWGDIRYSTCDGMSKVMAWNTVDEGLAWTSAMLDTTVVEPEAPKAPKAKRTRKPKDIAYEGHGKTLTAKQVDFILHLSDSCFWENGLESALWTDILCDEIEGQFAGKPMTVGAMISTLCEKGLAERAKDKINNRTATYMVLTELGKVIAAELGLN